MAIVSAHADLMQSLTAALDTTKILGVFTNLMTMIQEQQEKIDDGQKRITELMIFAEQVAHRSSGSQMENRLNALEKTVEDMKLNLHGMGNEDSSILHAKELTGYMAFQTSALGVVGAKSFDMGDMSGELVEDPSAFDPVDALPPMPEEATDDVYDDRGDDNVTPRPVTPKLDPLPPILADDSPAMGERAAALEAATLPTVSKQAVSADPTIQETVGPEGLSAEGPSSARAPSRPKTPAQAAPVLASSRPPSASEIAMGVMETALDLAESVQAADSQLFTERAQAPLTGATVDEQPATIPESQSQPQPQPQPQLQSQPQEQPQHPVEQPLQAEQTAQADAPSASTAATAAPQALATAQQQQQESAESSQTQLGPVAAEQPTTRPSSSQAAPLAPVPETTPLTVGAKADATVGIGGGVQMEVMVSSPMTGRVQVVEVRALSAKSRVVTPSRRRSTGTLDTLQPSSAKEMFSRNRRKMKVENLSFLAPKRRERICKELRRRGTFIRVSRELLEDARKRYSNRSLKQKMEYIEMDLNRVRSLANLLQAQVKKNTQVLKEKGGSGGSLGGEAGDALEILLRIVDEVGGMDRFHGILAESESNAKKLAAVAEETAAAAQAMEKMRTQLVKEHAVQLRDALQRQAEEVKEELTAELKAQLTSKAELDGMLSLPEINNVGKVGFTPMMASNPGDPAHVKMVALLNHAVGTVHDRIDSFEKFVDRSFREQEDERAAAQERKGEVSAELLELKASQYTDQQITHMGRYMEQKVAELEARRGELTDELAMMRLKLEQIEAKVHDDKAPDDPESLRREATAIRELQRRVANIPVDKLMEEMKTMQKDLRTRAVATDVHERISTTEEGLRGLLGENVVGLRSLLYEVFRHIQHKADRDDIRHLISAKLGQMEKEIVRREEEMLSVSSMTRCLSCGHASSAHVAQPHKSSAAPGQTRTGAGAGTASPPRAASPQQSSLVLDDEISMEGDPLPTSQYSSAQAEQVYSLLTGQAGLRPLHLQHSPLQPVQNPFLTDLPPRASTASSVNKLRSKVADKIPEPLYRKARMSQHVKEMVKVSAPGLQQQGFDFSTNPLYVLDSFDGAQRSVTSAPIVATDPGDEPALNNPFSDLTQPLSFSSLPSRAAQHIGRDLATSKSTAALGSSKARTTASNVLGGELSVGSQAMRLHNSYT